MMLLPEGSSDCFLVSNFLPTAAAVKVSFLVALQILYGILNIAAMVIDAYELPADFFKSAQEKAAENRREQRFKKNSISAVSFVGDGCSSKEIPLARLVNFSDGSTDVGRCLLLCRLLLEHHYQ